MINQDDDDKELDRTQVRDDPSSHKGKAQIGMVTGSAWKRGFSAAPRFGSASMCSVVASPIISDHGWARSAVCSE